MYRIRITSESVRDARGNSYPIAEADVTTRALGVNDRWHVHAKCPLRAWETFEIDWSTEKECLLQLVAKVSYYMGRYDEYTMREALRRRGAYQPGCLVTLTRGARKQDALAQLQVDRLADQRNTYRACWQVHGEPGSIARNIEYGPASFDVWALIMRASVLLAVRKYAPRLGMGALHV